MESFIDKMIFNPDQVSVVEFLANYFISLLSIAMPVFIFLGLVLTVFQWLISGADKRALIENFVKYLLAISLVSLLLFTEGRKNIQLDATTTTKSYFIIDTLNDFLVLGSRIADAFTYNFLFGFNYKNSDVPLFEFEENSFFKIKNYNTSPTPEEYVDGFFISGLLKNITDKIIQQKQENDEVKTTIALKYSNDIEDLKDVDSYIKTFIEDIDFVKTENFYKYKKIFDIALQENINKELERKQKINAKLTLKDITNDNKNLTFEEYKDIYNKTIDNIPFEYLHDFYNFRISVDTTTSNNIVEDKQKINELENEIVSTTDTKLEFIKYIYLVDDDKRPTRYTTIKNHYTFHSDFTISEYIPYDYVYNNIKDILNKDALLKGIEIIKDFYKEHNIQANYDIDKEIKEIYDFDKIYVEMKEFFYNEPKYKKYYELFNKPGYDNFEEAKSVVDLFFSYIRYKQIKIIGHMFDPVKGINIKDTMKVKDKIFFDRFNYFNNLLADTYEQQIYDNKVNDLGIQVQTRGIIIFKSNLANSLKLTEEQLNKALLRINTLNFYDNYSIGSEFINNDTNGFIKLKYLSSDFLIKSELNSILPGTMFDLDMSKYKETDNTAFHWYDLNRYAVGLKNLFLQTHTFYSNMGVYEETIKAKTLITTCLPIYQKINDNPKLMKTLDSSTKELCFSGSKSKNYTAIDTFSKFAAAIYGAKAGYKTGSFMKYFAGFGWIATIIVSSAIAVGIGYLVYLSLYSLLLMFIFLIPSIFIFIAVLSWVIRASMSMIFFGFSIIMYLFNKKKDRLIESFYTFTMYSIMPLFLTFIFFLIIHLSFVLSITVDSIVPNISVANYVVGDNYNEKIKKLLKEEPNIKATTFWGKVWDFFNKDKQLEDAWDAAEKTLNVLTGETLKIMSVMVYNYMLDIFKLVLILIFDIMLYINLWKVDKYINEIINTSVKSTEFDSQKILSTFAGSKGLRVITSAAS